MFTLHVRLYSRVGCHLCENALLELEKLRDDYEFLIEEINIDEDPALKDLTSVIALLGLPCGQVVSATLVKENDHIATCKDGNRYHVHLDATGRVVAEKQ